MKFPFARWMYSWTYCLVYKVQNDTKFESFEQIGSIFSFLDKETKINR